MIGEKLRATRAAQGLTQEELALRSGVHVRTLIRVEGGVPTRLSTLLRICQGLDTHLDSVIQATRVSPIASLPRVSRADSASWLAGVDRRRAVPSDNLDRLNDPAERRRLGRLDFVPAFYKNPHLIMPQGPGTVFVELHGRYEVAIASRIFRDCKVYVQEGAVRCRIGEETFELSQGDLVGYHSADLRWIEPLNPLADEDRPPLILWIGAVLMGST